MVIAAAIAGGTWEIRKDYIDNLKTEIESLKEADKWKVPETIKQLNAISEKLDKQMSFKEEYEQLKTEHKNFEETKKQLTEDLQKSNNENWTLKEKVSLLSKELNATLLASKEITLTAGESAELIKNKVYLGIQGIYSSFVIVRTNNEDTQTLYVSNNKTFNIMNETCTLTLTKITKENATFHFRCDGEV